MSKPDPILKLMNAAEDLGTLIDQCQTELDADQYRVIENNAEKAIVTIQRLSQQIVFIEQMIERFRGRRLRRRPHHAIVYDLKPRRSRPPRGPGSGR